MIVNHLNIVVADMARSLAFYIGLLGLRQTFEIELQGEWVETVTGLSGATAHCVFVMPRSGGCRLELLQYRAPEGESLAANALANTLGLRHFALEIDDLDAWYEKLRDAGIVFLSPPVTVPFRLVDGIQKRLCYLKDPDGVIVELCEHRSP